MKKIVSFVNPNFQQGPREFNAYYLPYTPAVLWSYVTQFSEISDHYELGEFIWRRDNIEHTVELLKNHSVVGFSTYVWNRSYNAVLARELKKANPNILIIGGGPEYPIEKADLFEKNPYIDICVKSEGEVTFKKILSNHLCSNADYRSIAGLLINDCLTVVDTGPSERINNLNHIPSPYQTGVFNKLMSQHPEIRWNATLETNRGCPYACTFCDWGSLTYNKVKKFSLNRVFSDLEWIGSHHCDFVSVTDANFGIFPDRDNLIADKLISVQKKYSYPKAYTISWAKNQKREIVDIVKKLIYQGGSKIGLNLSVQTMNDDVLEIIKRKNLGINAIEEVFEMCEEFNIPLFTELILGLPGETPASWKDNFYKLYTAGNHTGITIYQAQLFENAEMNLMQRKFYKLEGRVVYDYLIGTYNEHELQEGVEVITSTRDIPFEQMIECFVFAWFQNTFHINGMTNYISRFLLKYQNIQYETFYELLLTYIKCDPWFCSELQRVQLHYANWGTMGRINHTPIQGMEIHGYNLIHSTLINIHSDGKHDHAFDLLDRFVKEQFQLPADLHAELIKFQRTFLIDYKKINQYPQTLKFKYDFLGYIQHNTALTADTTYVFDFPEDKLIGLSQFCEQIFFARRRNFGKAWITKARLGQSMAGTLGKHYEHALHVMGV